MHALPLAALLFIAALPAPASAQQPTIPTRTEHADPMAPFARMMPGEWRMTVQSGASMYDTWHWGPGRHSVRVMTDGSGADGNPWREVQVYYWHPLRNEVRLLGLSPYARGVAEGTIRFEGDTAEAVIDMHQTRDRRELALRWSFEGPDRYHEKLLEKTGPEGFGLLAEWDHNRSDPPVRAHAAPAGAEPELAQRLNAFAPLLNHTWQTETDKPTGGATSIRTAFQSIPYADAIYARSWIPVDNGASGHLFDIYLYHHTGAGVLRCLALSDRGAVYEGDVAVLDGGALRFDLTGAKGDRTVPLLVRLDFDADGSVRQRVWAGSAAEGTPVLDLRHRKADPEND